jgi:hypothetical protein
MALATSRDRATLQALLPVVVPDSVKRPVNQRGECALLSRVAAAAPSALPTLALWRFLYLERRRARLLRVSGRLVCSSAEQ